MATSKLLSLADLQHIKFISARVTSAKVNKTAKVPAYICSLEVGSLLLQVHLLPYKTLQVSVSLVILAVDFVNLYCEMHVLLAMSLLTKIKHDTTCIFS